MSSLEIDRSKLRQALRSVEDDTVFYLLDRAIDLLSEAQLLELVRSYLPVEPLIADGTPDLGLLASVETFERASLAGDYYEDFFVNSRNDMETSRGTCAWIAECGRLLHRCVSSTDLPKPLIRKALERIFGLLRRIDACQENIIFFADEAGSWQVGVDWDSVFPCWFACLAETATPDEYAREVVSVVREFQAYRRDQHFTEAQRLAMPEQRLALEATLGSMARSHASR